MDGSKIHLSIKKLGDGASSDTDNDFFGLLRNFLRSHFSAQDTERVMSKFKEVCDMFLIILGVLASAVISHLKPKYLSFYCIITLVWTSSSIFFFNNLDANNLTLFFCMVLTY